MELEGVDAVNYLNGKGTVRDGKLLHLSVQNIVTEPTIELVFEVPGNGATRTVKLELRGTQEFNYGYSKDGEHVIELVKCLVTEVGEFYMSLDPYDERELFVSDQDNDLFR